MNNQTEKVREVLERYMKGTYTADIPMLESVFHKEARMVGYLGDQLLIGTPAPFIADMGSQPSMKEQGHNYQAEIRDLEVNGNVAKATVHETGFRGSAELVDHFHLLCENGEWKIISKTFTTID
nr:nuclear transport factor 2 family protein [uncultured Oscillibacter sp.]